MKLKERWNKKITMKIYQMRLGIIITLLTTLLLINIWPRFRYDVLSLPWYVYIILIALFLIPLLRGNKKKK